jgi:hypothetical protein
MVAAACTYADRGVGSLVGRYDLHVTARTGTAGGVAGRVVIEPFDSGGCAVAADKRDGVDTGGAKEKAATMMRYSADRVAIGVKALQANVASRVTGTFGTVGEHENKAAVPRGGSWPARIDIELIGPTVRARARGDRRKSGRDQYHQPAREHDERATHNAEHAPDRSGGQAFGHGRWVRGYILGLRADDAKVS